MIQLQEKEFIKLAEVTGVPCNVLQKLYAMHLINETTVYDCIIQSDFDKVKKTKMYKPSQIISRIAEEYCVTENRVKTAIYRKHEKCYYCEKCKKKIAKAMYKRNGGICDTCVSKSIQL